MDFENRKYGLFVLILRKTYPMMCSLLGNKLLYHYANESFVLSNITV